MSEEKQVAVGMRENKEQAVEGNKGRVVEGNKERAIEGTKEYSTSDIGLAGYLKLKGMEVKEVAERRGRTVFIFIDREDRRGLVYGYFNNHAEVDALTYKNILRDMKNFVINSL